MSLELFHKSSDEINELIESHLQINPNSKVSRGEVFTPITIINEMLDLVPKSLWNDPHSKWLDPGAGIGNFSMLVFQRLDQSLKSWESNSEKRKKHIVKNMIFMVETDQTNVNIARKVFGKHANISRTDYLEHESWKTDFNLKQNTQFDIILGNPPYNCNGMRGKGRSNPGLSVLWNKFVEESFLHVKPSGYILFFTPNSWTEFKSPLSRRMMKLQLLYYKNFDVVSSYKLFEKKAGSLPICYYLFENKEPYKESQVYDQYRKQYVSFDICKYAMIPNQHITLIRKMLEKNRHDNLSESFYFTPPKTKSDTINFGPSYSSDYQYPLVNYVHKKIVVSFGKNYTRIQNGRPKLLLPNYSMGYPILDADGIMDVGGRFSYSIMVENNSIASLKRIQTFFMTDLAFTVINALKTAQKFLSTRTFDIFPDVTNTSIPVRDDELVKYYGFTKQDCDAITDQVSSGEGNVTPEKKKELREFDLRDYITDNQYETIRKRLQKAHKDEPHTFAFTRKPRLHKIGMKLCGDAETEEDHTDQPTLPSKGRKKKNGTRKKKHST